MIDQSASSPTVDPGSYTPGEKRARIAVYMAIAMLTTASSAILNLAAMSDQQLAGLSALRWTFTISLALISIALSGLTVFRAAIDRSTAGGSDAPVSAAINPPASHEVS